MQRPEGKKKDSRKDGDRGKRNREKVLSFSMGEAWLSNNLIVALVCSLPQTASSCRAQLC